MDTATQPRPRTAWPAFSLRFENYFERWVQRERQSAISSSVPHTSALPRASRRGALIGRVGNGLVRFMPRKVAALHDTPVTFR